MIWYLVWLYVGEFVLVLTQHAVVVSFVIVVADNCCCCFCCCLYICLTIKLNEIFAHQRNTNTRTFKLFDLVLNINFAQNALALMCWSLFTTFLYCYRQSVSHAIYHIEYVHFCLAAIYIFSANLPYSKQIGIVTGIT